MMKPMIVIAIALAACGPKKSPEPVANTGSGTTPPPKETKSEIERRRDAACEALGPRITRCAVEDARKDYEAGKVKKAQYDQDTAPGVQEKNTAEFIKKCKSPQVPYSSRQVRVLEVCPKEESECGPMLACLDNLNKK